MSYIKGIDVLPQELLDLIQNYVDGEYIYITKRMQQKVLGGNNQK